MSISAMNWPNAMTANIAYFFALDSEAGSLMTDPPLPGGVCGNGIDAKLLASSGIILYASYKRRRQVRYSSEHKAETRQRVLNEAARAIRARGPSGVAVADV